MQGRGLPLHVIKELHAYLKCGILHHGFMRVKCDSCDFEGAVAFSCKKRGICPSCCGKRMSETSDHLMGEVLADHGYRQYVLSMPVALRFWCATNKKLLSGVHSIVKKELIRYFENRASALGVKDPLPGGISFIQRSGSALNLNVHFHILCLDGVYRPSQAGGGAPKFMGFSPPSDEDICDLVEKISKKVIQHLRRKGYLGENGGECEIPPLDEVFSEHPDYTGAISASVNGRIAFGENAGKKVRRIGSSFGYEGEIALVKGIKCASINGFSLHGATATKRFQRQKLGRLVKYISRPPLALSRLSHHPSGNGDLVYTLKNKWHDGTTAIRLSPMELMEKLAAIIPPPRSHLVRHWGVFGSHSKWRSQVVLKPEKRKGFAPDGGYDPKKVKNTRWARLLAKTFGVDVSVCPECGGEMRIVAMLHNQREISRYLKHIGLSEHPPPVASARYEQAEFDYSQDFDRSADYS